MSRIDDREKAVLLRKQGKTYSEIRRELQIAKSTLSGWLRNYPLTEEQFAELKRHRVYNKQIAAEKTRNIKQRKREERLRITYEDELQYWHSLSKRELLLAGLFLYWGEGNKSLKGSLSLNNCDPKVLQFTLSWLLYGLQIPKEKIKVYLHLYSDMDVMKEMNYWSQTLGLSKNHFIKPYIKESRRVNISHKGFGHGTCGLVVNDVRMKEKVIMAIYAIADSYNREL
jgi:hypothetical protein